MDDANSVLIANGTISAKSGFAVVDIIKFEMKVSISGSKVGLLLSNITRAQQNTGNMANDGFNPVEVWPMSRSEEAYSELEKMANNVKSCIGGLTAASFLSLASTSNFFLGFPEQYDPIQQKIE